MTLLIFAHPIISSKSLKLIQNIRTKHDQLFYPKLKPHFTLVYSVSDVKERAFIEEAKNNLANIRSFDFDIRCATLNKDAFNDYFHCFIVPDKGFSNILKIHDKLYSNLIEHHRRYDIDFIPHLELANSKNLSEVKAIVDEWNSEDIVIQGKINHIDIMKVKGQKIEILETIRLKRQSAKG